jgi:hypothetical protein
LSSTWSQLCEFLINIISWVSPPPPLQFVKHFDMIDTNAPTTAHVHTPYSSCLLPQYFTPHPRTPPSFFNERASPPRLRPPPRRSTRGRDVVVPCGASGRRRRECREGSASGGPSECPAATGYDAATAIRRLAERRFPFHRRRWRRRPRIPRRADDVVIDVDRRRLQPQAATNHQLSPVRALRLSQLRRPRLGMSVPTPREVHAGTAP